MKLQLIDGNFAVCRLAPDSAWSLPVASGFVSMTRTPDELSIVCEESLVPAETTHVELGWRMFRVAGPIAFDVVGLLASLTAPLAAANISIFAQSTFDTDYLMVNADKLDVAVQVLTTAGFEVAPN